jgi:heptosyltransferase-1
MSLRFLPDLSKVTRVLIIRMSAIGDVIHALPLASALKDKYPHLKISWLVEEIPAEVVQGNPDLEHVFVIPRSRWKRGRVTSPQVWREYFSFLAMLRKERFDVTIDLQGYAKSALFALASGAPYRLGWHRLRDGANLISHRIPKRTDSVHRVDWFLDVARELGVDKPNVRFPIAIPPDARESLRGKLLALGFNPDLPYAVINQAAGNPPRRWGLKRYAELAFQIASRHRLPTVLVGTVPEASDCDLIVRYVAEAMEAKGVTGVPAPVNLAGQTSLKELAALLEGCKLHVCGDTGSTHLAAALGVPVIAFYGSTDPAHAGPWGQGDHVLARRDLCSPDCTIRKCAFVSDLSVQPDELTESGGASGEALHLPDVQTARCLAAISVDQALDLVARVICK